MKSMASKIIHLEKQPFKSQNTKNQPNAANLATNKF